MVVIVCASRNYRCLFCVESRRNSGMTKPRGAKGRILPFSGHFLFPVAIIEKNDPQDAFSCTHVLSCALVLEPCVFPTPYIYILCLFLTQTNMHLVFVKPLSPLPSPRKTKVLCLDRFPPARSRKEQFEGGISVQRTVRTATIHLLKEERGHLYLTFFPLLLHCSIF